MATEADQLRAQLALMQSQQGGGDYTKLIIGGFVVFAIIYWVMTQNEDEPMPTIDPTTIPPGVIPVKPTGPGPVVVIDPTAGQSSGAGNAGSGQTSTVPPAGSGTTTPTNPLAGIKFIRLYSDLDFKGKTKVMLPGMVTDLATKSGSSWNYTWKSMRVTAQTKLEFTRYTGGGRTSRAFAFGLFDVKDIKTWMMSLPALSGNPSIDHGMAMSRDWSGGSGTIKMMVNTGDSQWKADMNKVQQGCLGTIAAWNRSQPGKYNASYCESSLFENASTTATISP